eukprot:COSAG01_NODE_2835_length_6985_cov_407.845083_11_plen_128_part_00
MVAVYQRMPALLTPTATQSLAVLTAGERGALLQQRERVALLQQLVNHDAEFGEPQPQQTPLSPSSQSSVSSAGGGGGGGGNAGSLHAVERRWGEAGVAMMTQNLSAISAGATVEVRRRPLRPFVRPF